MEGDARGQVGGLDSVSDEVRRQWAGMSRGWRCEACGKSNEEVLRDWKVFCVEQGVDVEKEEEVEGVPEGLRIGVGKNDRNKEKEDDEKKKDDEGAGDGGVDQSATEASKQDTPTSSGIKNSSVFATSERPAASGSSAQAQTIAPAPASASRTPPAPPTTSQQQRRPAPTRTTQAPPAPSQDSPWLDRAIFGVLVALILMILRRFVNLED